MTKAHHRRSESGLRKAVEGVGLAFGSALAFVLIVSVIFWIATIDVFESAGKDAGWVGVFYIFYMLILFLSSFAAYCALFSVAFPLLYRTRRDSRSGAMRIAVPIALATIGVLLIWALLLVMLSWSMGGALSETMRYLAVSSIALIVVTIPTSLWSLLRVNADLREAVSRDEVR